MSLQEQLRDVNQKLGELKNKPKNVVNEEKRRQLTLQKKRIKSRMDEKKSSAQEVSDRLDELREKLEIERGKSNPNLTLVNYYKGMVDTFERKLRGIDNPKMIKQQFKKVYKDDNVEEAVDSTAGKNAPHGFLSYLERKRSKRRTRRTKTLFPPERKIASFKKNMQAFSIARLQRLVLCLCTMHQEKP